MSTGIYSRKKGIEKRSSEIADGILEVTPSEPQRENRLKEK